MYKLQICCLIIVLFIAAVYLPVKRIKSYSHILFSVSLGVTAFNLVFDTITVYTVNHLSTVPVWVNRWCHILFLGSLVMEVFICYLYSITLIDEKNANKKRFWIMAVPVWASWLGLFFFPLDYQQTPKGNYSWGGPVFVVYGIILFYLVLLLTTMARRYKEVNTKKFNMVALAFSIQIVVMICQSVFPWILFSGAAITLINITFFMTVESPDVLLMERLKEEKERADDANEAKSRFLSNMSHEIRTPMNAIVGLTDVLLRKEWPEEEKKYLKNIKSSGNALLNLINDLLDFSKIESGKFVITEDEYEPLALVEDLKPIFLNRAGDKEIELEYEIDPRIPQVLWGDSARIRQIIINLVNNAIKFTEKGYVKLSIQVQQSRQDEVEICVSVQDSGQGIKKEDLSKLFDAFTQVDLKKNHTKEGTGLGLAICNQLVELMGGELHVESEYGKGSNFYFVMWQKVIAQEKETEPVKRREEKGASSEFTFTAPEAKILLVDDNVINREVAKALLEPLMMQIDEAENGLEALQMVQQKKYDMVFMDHYMPVMDGVEATMKIRALEDEHNRRIPILALTADAVAGEKEKLIEVGINEVLSKPIQIQEVCERIYHYLKKELIVEK